MASVYGIRKETTASGTRYLVDYRDSAGRRTKRRFTKARDAEAFQRIFPAHFGERRTISEGYLHSCSHYVATIKLAYNENYLDIYTTNILL